MNQSIKKLVERHIETGRYNALTLSYTVERMDEKYLSILFTGTGEVPGLLDEINVMDTITLDLTTSNEITFDKFVVNRDDLNIILEEKLGHPLEYEGMSIYFEVDNVVFYYMPLDDSARIFQKISVPFEDLSTVVTYDFGENPAS